MKNNAIIVVEDGKKFCYSTKEELVKSILGEDYYNLSNEEKQKRLEICTYRNAGLEQIPIININKGEVVNNIKDKKYIVFDEDTFILSLAKNNKLVIYEKEDANIFAKDVDKQNLKRISESYICINDCANIILLNLINSMHKK